MYWSGPPFTDVCAPQGSLERGQIVGTQWLNSLLHDPNPIEWGGYNAALARVEYVPKPATTYMFGPLIDAPPSHSDTVLTTLSYVKITLTELGMNTSNISADMQLYIVATLTSGPVMGTASSQSFFELVACTPSCHPMAVLET